MRALIFDSKFLNNAVFILDGLKSSDYQTATHLHDELLDLALKNQAPYCQKRVTRSRIDLFAALDEIRDLCREGVKPIIHIEAHGIPDAPDSGIVFGDDEEFVTWDELARRLGEINRITKNNTGVVMAACFGLYAITPITIYKPAPFYFLIGNDQLIEARAIDECMKKFYRVLFETDSLAAAMNQIEKRFKQFHVEKFLCIALGRYIKKFSMGRGADERIERYVSKRVEQGVVTNRESLRNARKEAKAMVRDRKGLFVRYARIFMHNRYAITFEQLMAFVTQKT